VSASPARVVARPPRSRFLEGRPRGLGRWAGRALSLVPLLFAVPVLGGIVVTLARLVVVAHPDAGFGTTVNADAGALYLGQPLYQDPDQGYSGILYMPLFPKVVSLLDRGVLWTGWPLLLTILATLAMVGLVARLTYRPLGPGAGDRLLAVLEALGIGALGWAIVSCIQLNGIYGGNGMHDQVAWALGLGGLALLPAAARGSRRGLVGALLLLTAAFWTKQNSLIASMAAVAWLGLGAALGTVAWRRAAGFAAALLGLNVALLGVVNLLTGGWELFFNFVVPSRHPLGDLGDGPLPRLVPKFLLEDLLPATALGVAATGALWLAVGVGRLLEARGRARQGEGPGPMAGVRAGAGRLGAELRRPVVVAVPLVLTLAVAVWFRSAGAINLYFLTAPAERAQKLVEGLVIPGLVLGLVFVAILGLVVAAREALRRRRGGGPAAVAFASREGETASLLVLFVALAVPISFYFRQKIGADDNYYVGIAWALALLGAIGYRWARLRTGTALAAGVVLAGLFAAMLAVSPVAESGERANAVNLPELARTTSDTEHESWLTVYFPRVGLVPLNEWSEVPADLRAYARNHLVYSEGFGDLNLRPQGLVWPNYDNFSGDLAAGAPPGWLIRAWLDRRFDAVSGPFNTDDRKQQFAWGSGQWEENILWKLNRVITAGYRKRPGAPAGLWERRPGPSAAPWMRTCFGPFRAAGAAFRINRGGGFWCRAPGTDRLALRDTPAPYSDVRTDSVVRGATGVLGVTLPAAGAFELGVEGADGPPLRVRGVRGPAGRVLLTAYRGAAPVGRATVAAGRGGALAITLGHGGPGALGVSKAGPGRVGLALPPLGDGAVLRLGATRGSAATFDLARLKLS